MRETADVVLPEDGLHLMPWVIDVAIRVRRTILINLAGAFGYNAITLTLAAAGWLQPLAAALLMVVSSLAVVINSLRLNNFYEIGAARLPFDAGLQNDHEPLQSGEAA